MPFILLEYWKNFFPSYIIAAYVFILVKHKSWKMTWMSNERAKSVLHPNALTTRSTPCLIKLLAEVKIQINPSASLY